MKRLFKIAFGQHNHRFLMIFTVLAMCLVTIASQLEIFSIGIITKKGPEFFQVLAPVRDGKLETTDSITKEQLISRWEELDKDNKGAVNKKDTVAFLSQIKNRDFIEVVIGKMEGIFSVSNNIKNLALLLVFVALFKAITLFCHRFSTRLVAIRISRDLRQDYFEHIQSLPLSFYQQYNIGSLSSRVIGDAALVAEALNACLVNYLQTPFTVITTLTLCFLLSWKLSLMIFFGFPAIVFPIVFLAKRVKRISKHLQQNQERFASVLIDFLSGIQTVKVFAMEEFSLRKYREHNQQMAKLEQKSARYDLSSRPIVHTIGMFFLSAALLFGLYGLQMSVSEVLLYCGMLYVFYEPIKKFAEENSHIQRGISAAERMFEVMALKPQIIDSQGAEVMKDFDGPIEFEDVWFRYQNQDAWILKGVSFKVNKGETVAIVGPTGAGKSTIAQLIPRLYDLQQGEIRINGKAINSYTQKSLRESIAFVPQKPFLFLDTVEENIAFGRAFTNEQVQDAAMKAYADEFICQLPQGYSTELAESGKNLSGGQQQRLAIARAFIKKAPILIMDEATSSLDAVSEHHIKTALRKQRKNMTQIIIAHRLSTIDDVDRIIYIEKGEKVAEGTKDELLKSCSGFKRMWDIYHAQAQFEVL